MLDGLKKQHAHFRHGSQRRPSVARWCPTRPADAFSTSLCLLGLLAGFLCCSKFLLNLFQSFVAVVPGLPALWWVGHDVLFHDARWRGLGARFQAHVAAAPFPHSKSRTAVLQQEFL